MQIIRRAEDSGIKESVVSEEKLQEFLQMKIENRILPNGYGLAVDIGTTTIAVSLYCMEAQRVVGVIQEKNRQCQMGKDVVMRLMHCQQGKAERLQQIIIEQIEQIAEELCGNVCSVEDIQRMSIVGNTTMCHIFAGKDTSGLTGSPFQTAYQGALTCKGEEIGCQKMPRINVYIVAGIDAHVGADTTAMITSLSLFDNAKIQLAIDMGTNAEIVLNDHGELTVCSAPAGPAFEGMEISCGMYGKEGAIAGMKLAPATGNIILDVIESETSAMKNQPAPKGICGSGLFDAVAQLLQYNLLRSDGYLLNKQEARKQGVPEFLAERLVEKGFLLYQGKENQIVLTQEDIRQFQLAKAAVQSGINVLLSSKGLLAEQVEQIWVAGVFGGHISELSARRIGLFPTLPSGRIKIAGNAAGKGAALALLSEEFCRISERVAESANHLELASNEVFQKEFLDAMELKRWGI